MLFDFNSQGKFPLHIISYAQSTGQNSVIEMYFYTTPLKKAREECRKLMRHETLLPKNTQQNLMP